MTPAEQIDPVTGRPYGPPCRPSAGLIERLEANRRKMFPEAAEGEGSPLRWQPKAKAAE